MAPTFHVRARREIAAIAAPAAARAADPIAELLRQPTDFADVSITVATYTTRGTDESRLRVLISSEIGAGPSVAAADFGFAVLREGNVVATDRDHIDAAADGPQVITMAALLLPGQYRLRYATVRADGRGGAADVPLTVGLRAAGEFHVSDLIVGVADADAGRLQPRSHVRRGAPLAALIDAVLLNQAAIDTARLPPGRYTAVATPILGDQPLGRVSRMFEIDDK